MRYISTRGEAASLGFCDTLLVGLARDGGLYVPETWPTFSASELKAMRGLSYADLAIAVLSPFVGDEIKPADFARMVRESYACFRHDAVCPIVQTGDERVCAGAVPRPDTRLQGCRHAAGGAIDGPCAGRARSARHRCLRHIGRHGQRGGRGLCGAGADGSFSFCFRMEKSPRFSGGR